MLQSLCSAVGVECPINFTEVKWVESGVQVFHILGDFLSFFKFYSSVIFYLHVLSLAESSETLNCSCGFLCSYFQFCFCLKYFEVLFLHACIFEGGLIFLLDEFFSNFLQFTFKLLLCHFMCSVRNLQQHTSTSHILG